MDRSSSRLQVRISELVGPVARDLRNRVVPILPECSIASAVSDVLEVQFQALEIDVLLPLDGHLETVLVPDQGLLHGSCSVKLEFKHWRHVLDRQSHWQFEACALAVHLLLDLVFGGQVRIQAE